jgi:hypothetical protein
VQHSVHPAKGELIKAPTGLIVLKSCMSCVGEGMNEDRRLACFQ